MCDPSIIPTVSKQRKKASLVYIYIYIGHRYIIRIVTRRRVCMQQCVCVLQNNRKNKQTNKQRMLSVELRQERGRTHRTKPQSDEKGEHESTSQPNVYVINSYQNKKREGHNIICDTHQNGDIYRQLEGP